MHTVKFNLVFLTYMLSQEMRGDHQFWRSFTIKRIQTNWRVNAVDVNFSISFNKASDMIIAIASYHALPKITFLAYIFVEFV